MASAPRHARKTVRRFIPTVTFNVVRIQPASLIVLESLLVAWISVPVTQSVSMVARVNMKMTTVSLVLRFTKMNTKFVLTLLTGRLLLKF